MKSYSFLKDSQYKILKEIRINKRYKYNDSFKVVRVNMKKVDLLVYGVDVSTSGIGFISDTEFAVDDMLEIIFKYDNLSIPATVKILHTSLHDAGYYIGGQFIGLQNTYWEVLKMLLLKNCYDVDGN